MPIDNPQAVRFSNERGRVCADALVSAYHTAKETLIGWDIWQLAELVPADGGTIADGADRDGRPPADGANVNALMAAAAALVDFFEANDQAVLKAALAISVNGRSRIQ